MFILFYGLWLIFNGRITVEILLLGLLIVALVSFFFYRLLGYRLAYDLFILRNLPLLILYILNLIKEIVIAAFNVIAVVWKPGKKPEPVLIEFHSGLRGHFSNVLLANSITLTPGTYTVVQEGDRFVVHCLRREFADDVDTSSFVKLLKKIRT